MGCSVRYTEYLTGGLWPPQRYQKKKKKTIHTNPYQFIPIHINHNIHTNTYQFIPNHIKSYQSIPIHTNSYQIIPNHTRSYQIIPIHTKSYHSYQHVPSCSVMLRHELQKFLAANNNLSTSRTAERQSCSRSKVREHEIIPVSLHQIFDGSSILRWQLLNTKRFGSGKPCKKQFTQFTTI